MAYFPFFINVKNKKCCIFGGGTVAYRKIEALLEFDADITVISPRICAEIQELKERLHVIVREYHEHDIEDAFFVIAATDDAKVNSDISKACMDRNILVNVVDELEECSFLFPAYVKKGDISIGVTTSGKSPVMAGWIKKMIQASLPDFYETLVNNLGGYRKIVKNQITSAQVRADIFKELAHLGMKNGGKVTLEDVEALIEKQGGHDKWNEKND